MTINYPRKRLEIMKMMLLWNRTEEDFEEESFIRRHRVLNFMFDRWCVIINVSFRIQRGVLWFWGRVYIL